jgi:hypothetical protein
MARAHGAHFFKCPLCNDKDIFTEAMKMGGIYVPDRYDELYFKLSF